jgi:hypothetical protein
MRDFGVRTESQRSALTRPPFEVMSRPDVHSAPWGQQHQPPLAMPPSAPYRPHPPNSKLASPSGQQQSHSHPQASYPQAHPPSPSMQHQQQGSGGYMLPQQDHPQKKSRTLILQPGPPPNLSTHSYLGQISLLPSPSSAPQLYAIPAQSPQATPTNQVSYMDQRPAHPYSELDDGMKGFLESPLGADGSNGTLVESPGNEPFGSNAIDDWDHESWAQLNPEGIITPYWIDNPEMTNEQVPRVGLKLVAVMELTGMESAGQLVKV